MNSIVNDNEFDEYEEICDLVCWNLSFGVRVEETLKSLGREDLIPELIQYNSLITQPGELV